jgi:presenilin-like A22 family membrane protease
VNITNPPKALIALVGLICLTVLIAVNAITSEAGLPVITAIVGYAIGNGISAKTGQPVEPIIGKKAKN